MITDKEIKEFWEKLGVEEREYEMSGFSDCEVYTDYPPIDLNSLFEFAVPKVIEHYKSISFDGYYHNTIPFFEDWVMEWLENEKDPAIALFRAIQQVFKEEN